MGSPGSLLAPDFNLAEVHYHSVRIHDSALTIDQLFNEMTLFTQRDLRPTYANGNVTGVGAVLGFSLAFPFDIGQGSFEVKVINFDPQEHFFVVQTLAGHPLAGYRYWGITQLPGGDLEVETFSFEQGATDIDDLKLGMGGLEAMYGTWTNFLTSLVRVSGGEVVDGPDTELQGRREYDRLPYFELGGRTDFYK